jgi:MFS family permease
MTVAQSGAPTSSLERDARRTNEAHAGEVRPGDVAIGVIIGRTSEFFDFFVYAIASVVVFPKLIFPYVDALTGTLYSFAIFALAFVARPLGTVIFTAIDRTYGRGMKLTVALFLLGCSTVAIAFVPSYESVGIASAYLLAILRIGQGLALGGSWDGLASLLATSAPPKHRGYYAMIPQLGAPLGLIVASGLFAYIIGNLSAEDFLGWGWRYPFFVAFAINVVALFARLRIVVTPEYTKAFETRELQPAPIGETLRTTGRYIVIGAFAPLASFALFHMVTVFPLSWVFLYTQEGPERFLQIEAIGAAVGVVAIVASGWLADRVGRRTLLAGTAAAIAAFSGFAPQLLASGEVGESGVRPGLRRGGLQLPDELSLHQLGAHLRPGVVVRRRLCALGGTGIVEQIRPGVVWRLPALRCGRHPGGAVREPADGAGPPPAILKNPRAATWK